MSEIKRQYVSVRTRGKSGIYSRTEFRQVIQAENLTRIIPAVEI